MKLTKKQMQNILDTLQIQYYRGGVISAEAEYMLMILFNNNADVVNRILEKWENER